MLGWPGGSATSHGESAGEAAVRAEAGSGADQLQHQLSMIVLPNKPTPAEEHAAEELARFIERMTGKRLPVLSEDERGRAKNPGRGLIVGRTESNLAAHDVDHWPRDTIYIGYGRPAEGAGDIPIIGQGSQGTLFAAYEFLRDQGCRWYAPDYVWPDDQFVPRRAALDLNREPVKHTPSFVERGWHPAPVAPHVWQAHMNDWAVRNGLNTFRPSTTFDYGASRGHGLQLRGGHTIWVLVPSADHELARQTFDEHPQWYPLVNGKRVMQYTDGRPVQACLSNPQVVEHVARLVSAYFREHPACWRFSVSPSDEPTWWCECDACIAMDGPGSTWRANDRYDAYGLRSPTGPGPMSTRWVTFVNQVARLVARDWPDKYVSFYAYGSTVAPPRDAGWKLEPNLLIEFAHGDGWCIKHDLLDPDCPPNASMHQWLSGWAETGNPTLFYDYPPNGSRFDVPSGVTRRYKSLLSYTKEAGVTGWAGENQGSWAGAGLLQSLKARLLWDIETDVDRFIGEYCSDVYGPAAAAMRTYYDELERRIDEVPGHAVWGSWATKLSPQALVQLSEHLDKAKGQDLGDFEQRNVAMVRVAFHALVMAWLEETDNAPRASALPWDYDQVRAGAQRLLKRHAIPVTDRWRDQVSENRYSPPFAALGGETVLELADGWRLRLDPDDEGLDARWHAHPPIDDGQWRDVRVDRYWTEQGLDYHGAAWYATTFLAPAKSIGRMWLLFGMIDGDAQIWVNGRSVGTMSGDPWDKPKAVDITGSVEPGDRSQLVVRVYKQLYAAGNNGFVRITASEN